MRVYKCFMRVINVALKYTANKLGLIHVGIPAGARVNESERESKGANGVSIKRRFIPLT